MLPHNRFVIMITRKQNSTTTPRRAFTLTGERDHTPRYLPTVIDTNERQQSDCFYHPRSCLPDTRKMYAWRLHTVKGRNIKIRHYWAAPGRTCRASSFRWLCERTGLLPSIRVQHISFKGNRGVNHSHPKSVLLHIDTPPTTDRWRMDHFRVFICTS